METLKEKLENLSLPWKKGQENELAKRFEELAPYFLYGGYVSVLDRYRIYIQRVEFYFHSENDGGIQDKIVYHRDNNHVLGKIPYFKPITFHAHASGYDMAFENEDKQYRASALIRAYEIFDEKGKIDEQDKIEKHFLKANKDGVFEHCAKPYINTQSTYLYDILNGFGDAGSIKWIDEPRLVSKPTPQRRLRVYVGDKWKDAQYKEPREREWSFTREILDKI